MDDLLLAEFHQAGIYLPKELAAIKGNKHQTSLQAAIWAEQMRRLGNMSLEERFAHEMAMGYPPQPFRGPQPVGLLIGGLFDGRFV